MSPRHRAALGLAGHHHLAGRIRGCTACRALWHLLVGGTVAAALAGTLAFVFGRRIAGRGGPLVRIARAVERGQRAQPLTGVTEVNTGRAAPRGRRPGLQAQEEAAARAPGARHQRGRPRAERVAGLDAVLGAAEAVHNLVQADSARIALVEEAGPFSAIDAGVDRSAPGLRDRAWPRHRWSGPATGRPVRTDDVMADPRFRADRYISIARTDGIVSCMAVPIVTADGVVGVIYANYVNLRPFSAVDEGALVMLADHAAVAVQKARLLAAEHAARSEAEASSRGKDELLAMLGHELRNPLAAIANATHVLDVPNAPAESTRRAREIIARQNTHLAHLVDDLLDVARVTSGKIVSPAPAGAGRGRASRRGSRWPPADVPERHHVSLESRAGVGRRRRDALGAGRHQSCRQRAAVPPTRRHRRHHARAVRWEAVPVCATPGWASRRSVAARV
jgi:GAF domain-containing protein